MLSTTGRPSSLGSLGVLYWIFIYTIFLHCSGLYIFTKGFLLTRLVLDDTSSCQDGIFHDQLQQASDECWMPAKYDKAIIVLIDALRYDFLLPFPNSTEPYHNVLTFPSRMTTKFPRQTFISKFVADAPTTTLQRLKGITTGSLPTFIDAGSNFAGTEILEDNLIMQLNSAGRRIAFLGDDTWLSLFPTAFKISHPFESLNTWDLYTVDNGVSRHLFPLLQPQNASNWDILIAHYLGVDHAGHRYGPRHEAMGRKLSEMDDVLERVVGMMDNSTLLVVMGDHGMDSKGNHGGDSVDEIEAGLWLYAKMDAFAEIPSKYRDDEVYHDGLPPIRRVRQIDLLPTLSLLLGLPVPYNNLGFPIPEAFFDKPGQAWANLGRAACETAAQLLRYRKSYEITGSKLDLQVVESSLEKCSLSQRAGTWEDLYVEARNFQQTNLKLCRALWAEFDSKMILIGIAILSCSVVFLYHVVQFAGRLHSYPLQRVLFVQFIGCLFMVPVILLTAQGGLTCLALLIAGSTSSLCIFLWSGKWSNSKVAKLEHEPYLLQNFAIYGIPVVHAALFASNSFTVWEDRILLSLTIICLIISAIGLRGFGSITGQAEVIILMILSRLSSMSTVCREEQMPSCRTSFSNSASTLQNILLMAIFQLCFSIFVPWTMKAYVNRAGPSHSSVKTWINYGFTPFLLLSSFYWIMDNLDDGRWPYFKENGLKVPKLMLGRSILGCSMIASNIAWALGLFNWDRAFWNSMRKSDFAKFNLNNLSGSYMLIFILNITVPLVLMQKPSGAICLMVLLWQLLSIAEISTSVSHLRIEFVSLLMALLSYLHFFSTGHQATIASVQWNMAFIPSPRLIPVISPLAVLLNSFPSHILVSVSLPLVVLWRNSVTTQLPVESTSRILLYQVLYHSIVTLSATIWAAYFRRHLMVWKIFAPRFMMGGIVLLVMDLVVFFVGLLFACRTVMRLSKTSVLSFNLR